MPCCTGAVLSASLLHRAGPAEQAAHLQDHPPPASGRNSRHLRSCQTAKLIRRVQSWMHACVRAASHFARQLLLPSLQLAASRILRAKKASGQEALRRSGSRSTRAPAGFPFPFRFPSGTPPPESPSPRKAETPKASGIRQTHTPPPRSRFSAPSARLTCQVPASARPTSGERRPCCHLLIYFPQAGFRMQNDFQPKRQLRHSSASQQSKP